MTVCSAQPVSASSSILDLRGHLQIQSMDDIRNSHAHALGAKRFEEILMSKPQPSPRSGQSRRVATNVSLDAVLVEEARALEINLSRACEEGLKACLAQARRARWLAENRDALDSSNAWVEVHGLPLASKRRF
jgi:antitoxin CcdA